MSSLVLSSDLLHPARWSLCSLARAVRGASVLSRLERSRVESNHVRVRVRVRVAGAFAHA